MTSPPKPPVGLLKGSRDRWRQFWESPAAQAVNLESDLPRLTRWIQAADEYDRAARTVREARQVRLQVHRLRGRGLPELAPPVTAALQQADRRLRR